MKTVRLQAARFEQVPPLLFVFMVLFAASAPFALSGFPLDDAWIHRVYARAFAFGHGFEYNPGQPEAGSTSPLWSILTAPAEWTGVFGTNAVVATVKLFGVLLGIQSVRFAQRIATRLLGSRSAGTIAAAFLALDPRLAFASLSGMEGTLALFLWLGAIAFLLNDRNPLACLFAALAPTARPECVVFLPFFAGAFVALRLAKEKRSLRDFLPLLLLPLPLLAWSLFCLKTNGHPLPTTFYAKQTPFAMDARRFVQLVDVAGHWGIFSSLLALLLPACILLLDVSKRRRATLLFAALLPLPALAYLVGVVGGRDFRLAGYYWTRWAEVPGLLLSLAAGTGVAALALRIRTSSTFGARMGFAALLLALSPSASHWLDAARQARFHLGNDAANIHDINVRAGEWIAENTSPDDVVAVTDAGAIRYFGRRSCLDLCGLNFSDRAFDRRPVRETLDRSKWVATFPTWFPGEPNPEVLRPAASFGVPKSDYTITKNPARANLVIYRNLRHPEK